MSRHTKPASLWRRVARALTLPLLVVALVAAWTPSTSEGDYTITWGDPVVTLNEAPLEWDEAQQGYRLVLTAAITDAEEAQANGVAHANGKAAEDYEVVVDLADPEADRPTPCAWNFEQRHVRVCTCHRTADRVLTGLCDSLLDAAAVASLTSAGRACPAGTFPDAHLAIADADGEVFYEKQTTRTKDLQPASGAELIFPEVTLFLGGAYGIWELAAGAQEIRVYLRSTAAGEPGLGDWASSEEPGELSSYEFGFLLWVGFLGWGLPPLNLHYSRPLGLEQIVP